MMQGQMSIWDFQEERLADRYQDGIPETIEEVVEIVEQRTGLKFKEVPPYKSMVGIYKSKCNKVTFELNLGRFAEGVHGGSRYISTSVDGGLWGRNVPAYDIDETLSLIKRWKGEYE